MQISKFIASIIAGGAILGIGVATAADLPAATYNKVPPIVAATPWTGSYVNGGIGYGLWAADATTSDPATGACHLCKTEVHGGKGWLATFGAGYDYQLAPKIVAGVFGDASISSLQGTVSDRALGSMSESKQTSSWAFGARAGWLVTPQTMSYLNAGYAGTRFSGASLVTITDGSPTGWWTPGITATGWFLGGGVETSVSPGWFWRTEYRYAYYGDNTIPELPNLYNINFRPSVQTVTGQLVYKFNGGLPTPLYPAAAAMATNWTGFHAAAGLGYGVWAADTTLVDPATGVCFLCVTQVEGGKGHLGRVGAGYDLQFAPSWVAGAFGDFDISGLKGSIQDGGAFAVGTIKQTSAWAVGPRLGWLPSPQTMAYVNGGYTGARFSGADLVFTTSGTPIGISTAAFSTSGWFIGAGVETTFDLLGKGWFWRNEYRYANYGSKTILESPANLNINFKPTVQTAVSEIVFKFN